MPRLPEAARRRGPERGDRGPIEAETVVAARPAEAVAEDVDVAAPAAAAAEVSVADTAAAATKSFSFP